MNAYPGLPNEFYTVFADRIKSNNFNDARLEASVNHVIDTCIYPHPTIAQFISYDKRIDLFNFTQMQEKTNTDIKAFERYKMIKVNGLSKPMWTASENVELYNLELWKTPTDTNTTT